MNWSRVRAATSRRPTTNLRKRVEAMTETTTLHTAKGIELMAFRIGAQEFCIDIVSVREIRGWTPATALPHSPGFVRGVINLRGAVLPIVDLAARLGLESVHPTSRHVIIVAQVGRQII